MRITASSVIRWAGLAAMGAGLLFIAIQPLHPADVLPSVTTGRWAVVHSMGVTMALLAMLGVTGLYARQVNRAGWLGLVGYLLFSAFWAFTLAFQFIEATISPLLAVQYPKFVEAFLGIITGAAGTVSVGALPTIYQITGGFYVLGGLLFGIATFRARVLPRWGGALLAVGAVAPIVLAALPHPLDRTLAVPMGAALAWLGFALWADRRAEMAKTLPGGKSPQLRPTAAMQPQKESLG